MTPDHKNRLIEAGREDYQHGLPIDHFYDRPDLKVGRSHQQHHREVYEFGWRTAREAHKRASQEYER